MMPIRRLSLTDFTCKLTSGAREKTLRKALEAEGVMQKWAASSWAKKLAARQTRSEMNDFDRFKMMVAKKKRTVALKAATKTTKPTKKASKK